MNSNGCFQTPDMTLVVYLCCRHIMYTGMELDGDEVKWNFERTDALERDLELYRQSEALIEPVTYVRRQARVRKEMFRFKEQQTGAAE